MFLYVVIHCTTKQKSQQKTREHCKALIRWDTCKVCAFRDPYGHLNGKNFIKSRLAHFSLRHHSLALTTISKQ